MFPVEGAHDQAYRSLQAFAYEKICFSLGSCVVVYIIANPIDLQYVS